MLCAATVAAQISFHMTRALPFHLAERLVSFAGVSIFPV
jgi:hypothetical protein